MSSGGHGGGKSKLIIIIALVVIIGLDLLVRHVLLDTFVGEPILNGLDWLFGEGSILDIIIRHIVPLATLIFAAFAMYYWIKMREAHHQEEHAMMERVHAAQSRMNDEHREWKQILELSDSVNPNDWRLAIIEADKLLEKMLIELGYEGEGVGGKLTNVSSGDFPGIQDAWEAHKVRNRIAHEGMSYVMSDREKRETIARYERVFKGAGII